MTRLCRNVFVSGRVQGVAFRYYSQLQAVDLRITGWVRNLGDGRVELWIEGEEEDVDRMLDWLEKGPPAARVTKVDVRESEPEGLAGFEIRHTSYF